MREEPAPKRTIRPQVIGLPPKNGHAVPPSTRVRPLDASTYQPTTSSVVPTSTTKNPLTVIAAAHPQDNEIAGSVNIRSDQSPNVNIPLSVENDEGGSNGGAKLNMGAVVALGSFGLFVLLAAVITTIVILVRR